MSIYRGRFAPSPTGLLHFGSLFAAVISYLEAKSREGEWLIRIEDIDPLREQKDSKQAIIQSLAAHGLISDRPVVFQSERSQLYEKTLSTLAQSGFTYACPCSRKYLNEHQGVHQPSCRNRNTGSQPCAIKFRADTHQHSWHDQYQGLQTYKLSEDFVLKRKEGFYAYQLAVVCDDIEQEITHITRGYDLLDSTPMQLALYQALAKTPPVFGHFPVITNDSGQKLSKQNLALPINDQAALSNLLKVFRLANIQLSESVSTCAQALYQASLIWHPDYLFGKRELRQACSL